MPNAGAICLNPQRIPEAKKQVCSRRKLSEQRKYGESMASSTIFNSAVSVDYCYPVNPTTRGYWYFLYLCLRTMTYIQSMQIFSGICYLRTWLETTVEKHSIVDHGSSAPPECG